MLALDGKDYAFDETMTMICDDAGPEAIGGIMGGELSGCTEETVNVFIEAAYFDPVRTAASGRKLKVHSDARYRFERGVDPAFTPMGMELGTKLILDLCGGEPSDVVVAGAAPDTARSYTLRASRVAGLVGMDVPQTEQARILTELGFGVTEAAETLEVSVPSWRPDVHGEADLVEEVARVASLTKLEGAPLPRPKPGVPRPILTPMQRRVGAARRALAAAGLNECVTYSFISESEAAAVGETLDAARLENPISSDMSQMRPSLLPGLLAAAARNQARGFADMALFEIGPEFSGAEPGEERVAVSGVFIGHTTARDWSGARRPVDLYDAKSAAVAALEAAGAPTARLMTLRDAPGWLHPGRSAQLKLGPKNALAAFGELHPKLVESMGVKGPAAAFTVFLENIPAAKSRSTARPALSVSDYQSVERDFAFVVGADVEADTLLSAARGADKTRN
jgi:phenylalanyl-tRNA synthetase beta chain